jgi:hypothetical protein
MSSSLSSSAVAAAFVWSDSLRSGSRVIDWQLLRKKLKLPLRMWLFVEFSADPIELQVAARPAKTSGSSQSKRKNPAATVSRSN